MPRMVVDLRDRRPIWAIPDWAVERLRESLPEGWELQVADSFADGSGDGGRGGTAPELLEALRGASVYLGYGVPPTVLEAGGETLRWVHTGTAGVGGSLHEAMRRSHVRFTNSAGIHGPPMAETVIGMLLHFFRGFDLAWEGQREGRWHSRPFFQADAPVRELSHATVGILGYGGIGREIALRLQGFGTRILGHRRSPSPESRDELGTELLHGDDGLARLLAESDALVLTAPDTPETRGILNRGRIRALRRGTVLVNVARGSLVDEEALVEALRDGHLRGAGLDVFAREPLPEGHPLRTLSNVLITPHVSAVSHHFWHRQLDLILENFRRFLADPNGPLLNEVDRERGY